MEKLEEKFKIGDIVQLKSGGPEMTVSSLMKSSFGYNGKVKCDWFDKDNKTNRAIFHQDQLEITTVYDGFMPLG